MSDLCPEIQPARDNNTYHALTASNKLLHPADNDSVLIAMFLHGRSPHTQRAYRKDISDFLSCINKSINIITLADLQRYSDCLCNSNLSPTSIKRKLWTIKSLFGFAAKMKYIPFNTGMPLKLPAVPNQLTERILTVEEVRKLIEMISNRRDKLIVMTLYYTGMRVSELTRLCWKDLKPNGSSGQMTLFCKGGKSNTILLPQHLWKSLLLYRGISRDENPIFCSRNGTFLNTGHLRRRINKYGITYLGKKISPHFFRHSHATHAIQNGCPLHIIQKQLNHTSISTTSKYLHARPTESSSKYLK